MIASVLSIQDYFGVIKRKKWLITSIIIAAAAVGAGVCLILPKSYRSSTLIVVESQRIPDGYFRGALTSPPQDRLATIQQLVLSRSIIGRVIEEFKLHAPDQDPGGAVLESLRRRVTITTTREQAFMLSFSHENPSVAQQVTSRLAALFIEQNLKTREQLVNEASDFLEFELNASQQELEIKEKAISEFKLSHMGELPGQIEANLRALDRLQGEMTATSESIMRLNERLSQAEKGIKEFESGESVTAVPGAPGFGVQAATVMRPADLRTMRIKELERNLANLSASYKDTYPDIVHLKQEIAKLKVQPIDADELKVARDESAESERNGEKVQEKKALDPYLRELIRQRNEIKMELVAARDRQERVSSDLKQYGSRVDHTPMREQQLAGLTRDYDNMQRNYQGLLDRRLNARLAESLEKRQKGEQFRIIDPAHFPTFPESPDVFKIMMMALVAGCGLGFGSAIVIETMRSSFRHGDEVERLLGIPILAEVPSFQSAFAGLSRTLSFGGTSSTSTSSRHTPLPVVGKATPGNGNGKGKKDVLVLDRAPGTPDWNLVMKWRPLSAVAEQYRVAATRLALMSTERKSTVVVVTSSVKGEGKTTTALNVGYALAHDLGKRTLMIDCDFKQPRLNVYAGVSADPGLSAVLQEIGTSMESCIHQLDESSLWILPAGSVSVRPVELYKIRKLGSLLAELQERFDFIILDAPPILPLADMNVFASMGDILALVIRSGETRTDIVQKALKALKALRPPNQTGIILTGIHENETPYYMRGEHYAVSNNPKR
jgi:polysaccharide chain length determinant protein (PEP-CTERM system associated)